MINKKVLFFIILTIIMLLSAVITIYISKLDSEIEVDGKMNIDSNKIQIDYEKIEADWAGRISGADIENVIKYAHLQCNYIWCAYGGEYMGDSINVFKLLRKRWNELTFKTKREQLLYEIVDKKLELGSNEGLTYKDVVKIHRTFHDLNYHIFSDIKEKNYHSTPFNEGEFDN